MVDEGNVDSLFEDAGNPDGEESAIGQLDAHDGADTPPADTPPEGSPNDAGGSQDGEPQEPGTQDALPDTSGEAKGDESFKDRYDNLKTEAEKWRAERDQLRQLNTANQLNAAREKQQSAAAAPQPSVAKKLAEKYKLEETQAEQFKDMVDDAVEDRIGALTEQQRKDRNELAVAKFEGKNPKWKEHYPAMEQVVQENPGIENLPNAMEVIYKLAKEAKLPQFIKAVEARVRKETLAKIQQSTPTSGGIGAGAAPTAEQEKTANNKALDSIIGDGDAVPTNVETLFD